ncbi:hypothetical protein N7491_008606 [Penicillium cf. griseofulvum]|nr:hypothetical protein N7491_008606 [Penicillium cf. griseofulvum]KAJ5431341.1 hypothetical protein N7445_009073 [Penicillium cf. griseofulvum]
MSSGGMTLMDEHVATGACPEHATSHQLRVGKEFEHTRAEGGRELSPMFREWTSREFQRRIRSRSVGAKSADLLQSIVMIPIDAISSPEDYFKLGGELW